MSIDRSDSRAETLGELILGLEAGKPCPWCGCSLEPGGLPQEVYPPKVDTRAESSAEPLLRCPCCGTEVRGRRASMPAGRKGSLGAAA